MPYAYIISHQRIPSIDNLSKTAHIHSNPAINAILHVKYNSYNYEYEFIARCSKSIHLDTFLFFNKLNFYIHAMQYYILLSDVLQFLHVDVHRVFYIKCCSVIRVCFFCLRLFKLQSVTNCLFCLTLHLNNIIPKSFHFRQNLQTKTLCIGERYFCSNYMVHITRYVPLSILYKFCKLGEMANL